MCRSDGGAQLYELVGFPYYGVYLGLLDVYYAAGARQEVHCELGKIDADAVSIWRLAQTIVLNQHIISVSAWSPDFKNWHRIDEGHDLIPLGPEGSFESHICCA